MRYKVKLHTGEEVRSCCNQGCSFERSGGIDCKGDISVVDEAVGGWVHACTAHEEWYEKQFEERHELS